MNKELKIEVPEGYEIDQKNSTFEKIVFKKKHTYPKSWEEFCENNETTNKEYFIGWDSQVMTSCIKNKDYDKDRNLCKTEEEAEAFLALMQLKRLWHEYVDNCSEKAKNNRDLLISTCIKYGFIVNENEWWHFYDERIKDYGMKKSFINSDLIPLYANEVFILKE